MTSIDVKYKILAHGKKHRFEGAFSHGLVFCAKYGWRLVSTYMLMILQRKRSTVNTDELVPLCTFKKCICSGEQSTMTKWSIICSEAVSTAWTLAA